MTERQFYSVLNKSMPDYTPVEKIGAGSFGSVYKCERDGMYYAIKIIPVPGSEEELQQLLSRSEPEEVQAYLKEKVESYRREIKLMAELKGNRNIVNIEDYKVVEEEEHPGFYIVIRMELLKSLVSHVGKGGMDEEEVIRLGMDICDALSICEKHGVIHRDIKPENIMLHNDGAYKLGDFGIAKQLAKTTAGTVAGTDGYMAPEVGRGLEYNHTADIYSLGVLLYCYLNNGKMPFVAPDNKSIIAEQEAIVKRINTYEALPFPPNANEELAKVVVKACMFDKGCRYQSAAQMKEDLQRVLNGETVDVDLTAEAPMMVNMDNGSRYEPAAPSPFNGSMIGPKPSKGSKKTKPTQEIKPKKKKKKGLWIFIGIVVALIIAAVGVLMLMNYINNQPTTYIDANGNEIQTISRNQMAEAYALGVEYFEQGKYENAITELAKVTDKSSKYEDAQAVREEAMAAYANKLIEQSGVQMENGNYEAALGIVESGMTLLGDDAGFYGQVQSILETLKLDMLDQATGFEEQGDYVQAFSCIQIAAAFLPEDMEVQSIYTRLYAMSVAQTALVEAEEYMEDDDQEMAFAVLEDAMEKAGGTQAAASKITLAYDSYKKEYLAHVEKLAREAKKSLDFEDAEDALSIAADIFPDEKNVQKLYKEISDLNTAHTAVNEAAELAEAENYEELFQTMQTAMEQVESGSEADDFLTESYETYKEAFVTNLNEQIGEPKTETQFEAAVALLETAVKLLPDDVELERRLEELKKNIPVNLFKQNVVDMKWLKYDNWVALDMNNSNDAEYLKFGQSATDNFGNTYHNATILGIGKGWYTNNATYVVYDCEDYNRLVGTVAVAADSKSFSGSVSFVVTGFVDATTENIIYNVPYPSGTRPQTIELDISKYSMVKLEMVCHKQGGTNVWAHFILSDFAMAK